MRTKKCVEWGFGYGESEYEVSFGLAPRNGELLPSDPQTPEPFNSSLRSRSPDRSSDSNSPPKLGSVGQNPEIKGQCFLMSNDVINFFDLSNSLTICFDDSHFAKVLWVSLSSRYFLFVFILNPDGDLWSVDSRIYQRKIEQAVSFLLELAALTSAAQHARFLI